MPMTFPFRTCSGLLLALLLLTGGCTESPVEDASENPNFDFPSLADQSPFPVGVALQTKHLDLEPYAEVLDYAFNSLSAEYEMKPRTIWQGRGQYNWGPPDRLIEFAEDHGMRTHFHALVWHSSVPDWLEPSAASKEDFEAMVKDYITTVVGRYKGRVASWDVVNEAFEDGTGRLRNTPYSRFMGPDYVARCFQYAREADPDAILFYNDYGTIWDDRKRQALFAMLDDFQARGIPIDGVGLQMHISYTFPAMSEIMKTIDGIVARGLRVHLSELDVRINPEGNLTAPTPDRLALQKARVHEVVNRYRSIPAGLQHGITMWGLRDGDSWLISFWGNPEWPLLFDDAYTPKPAYFGFLEALQ